MRQPPEDRHDWAAAGMRELWHRRWLMGLLLIAATILVYLPARNGDFIWDDDAYVTGNPLLTAPDGLRRIWFSLDSPSQYFPLTYTSFRIERSLWGLDPRGYHWVNILLHAANAILVWRLLAGLGVPGAWLASAMFALHPVHVESVAWITERKNVLSLLLSLLSLLAWVEFIGGRAKRPVLAYVFALLLFILALCAKTTACTLPAALLLILWFKRQPINRVRLIQIIPFLAAGAGMGMLAVWWERYHQGTQGSLFQMTLVERILVASRAAWFYAGKLAWPVNLTFSYPRWTINPRDPIAYAWLVAGAVVCSVIVSARRWFGRGIEAAMAFYLLSLAPLLGFIMLYTFRYSFVADHYQYVASIGSLALAGAAFTRVRLALEERSPLLGPCLSVSVLFGLGALTWLQSGMYRDSQTLWQATLADNPQSPLAHYQIGNALLKGGRVDDAIAQYETVLQLSPRDDDVHYNLANVLLRRGRVEEAIAHYQKALEIRPRDPEVHNNLSSALVHQTRLDEAVAHLRIALEIRPNFPEALNNLGYVAWVLATSTNMSVHNASKAITVAEAADRLSGGTNPLVTRTLATALAETGRVPEAEAAAARGLRLATELGNASLVSAFQKQLQLLNARTSAHEPAKGQTQP